MRTGLALIGNNNQKIIDSYNYIIMTQHKNARIRITTNCAQLVLKNIDKMQAFGVFEIFLQSIFACQ